MIAVSRYNPTGGFVQVDGSLFSYDPEGESLPASLEGLSAKQRSGGLETQFLFSEQGWVARFLWPDWPPELSQAMSDKVDEFHRAHRELARIPEASQEWEVLNRGWCSDQASAKKIFECFDEHFPSCVEWTRSEKNSRGAIEAKCSIRERGVTSIHLSWRSFAAEPLGPYNSLQEMEAYQAAVKSVFSWARGRIQPILDALHDKLTALYGDRFRGLYVFGSYARPDAGIELPEDSDLDVALLLSNYESGYKEMDRCGSIVSDLSLKHRLIISLVPLLEADFREGRTNFSRVISEYAISVSPNDEGDGSVLAESAAISKGQ